MNLGTPPGFAVVNRQEVLPVSPYVHCGGVGGDGKK